MLPLLKISTYIYQISLQQRNEKEVSGMIEKARHIA